MDKLLELKIYVDGGINDTPFPNTDNPIEIGAFRYDAKRMGGAPTITASVNYPSCLDDEWTDNVYAEFNGEKYYLKQTPTSSYDNDSLMYKHEIELISERVILDNVYFFDAVTGNPQGEDKPVSNSTKVVFFGDIHEFAARLQSSLEYSGIYYTVIVDDNIETEEKLMSFEDQFFSNVLQEIYNVYEVPYYFAGKTIHIGYANDSVPAPTFAYGVDDALLSISKNNSNFKVVNRATGTGSSDNIPFYYPNNSPKGVIAATPSGNFEVKILDTELYSNEIKLDGVIRKSNVEYENAKATFGGEEIYSGETFSAQMGAGGINKTFGISFTSKDAGIFLLSFSSSVTKYILKEEEKADATFGIRYFVKVYDRTAKKYTYDSKGSLSSIEGFEVQVPHANHEYSITIECYYAAEGKYAGKGGQIAFNVSYSFGSKSGWMYEDKVVELKDVGLEVVGNTVTGDTITQTLVKYVNTSKSLMPFKYRETDGKERFYNATNDTYEGITFNNPFIEGKPKEHIITIDDIKPSIKEAVNSMGLRMDMFSEFAYDLDDNDELVENEEGSEHEYVHSYFFAKLRKLDFNLFDHAIEQQPMTISFTSGDCGACNFTIGVTEEFPQKNPVQVNADGTLKRDENGRVVCGQFQEISEDECQPQQQDTINNEVWIALKKEDETYGILMPKAPKFNDSGEQIEVGHRPKPCTDGQNDGDTFVILGINLPESYIINAEKKLEAEIIKYLKENNEEKFNFSISFSRIYFEENQDILRYLNENSRVNVIYNDKTYLLYITSFSYQMSEGEILPQITVELDDSLSVSQNAMQNAISEVKSEVGRVLSNIDVVGLSNPYFIRKDADDEARGRINFTKGIKFGEGGKVEVMDNNSAKLTIEYLEVTKKASFTSLEIQEKTHVGGQILVTPASINCGEVEELDDVYRCHFQTKGIDGDEIFNQFAVGDQAICQTYNAWGSVYYWRLVTGIGEDYIDLSKTDCDENSGTPKAGDKIIQLGNREDVERQNAIVIAAYGDGSPYIIQYKGINSFEIGDDKVVTKLSSTENIFTGKVHMEMGSDGVENLNLEIGGQNLLRNSGFTGDYLSEQLADDKVLEAASELYSSPLDHWQDAGNINVVDSTRTTSGKEVELDGVLSQNLFYKTELGSNYVLSFMAKGEGSIVWTLGTQKTTIELGAEWAKYESTIEATSSSVIFIIEGQGDVIIGDLKLEKGNVATSWSSSPLDNASDRAYYQSMKYIQNAFEGATDIKGGLVLTEQIKVGDYDTDKKEWVKMNGGMSGVYESDDDVAFWAGGTDEQAIETVMQYADNPTFQPTEEQLASMAKFVVTHGGKAILNDIILRGIIYAKGGSFGDLKIGKYVNACGQADAEDSVFTERSHTSNDINYHTMVKLASGAIVAEGTHYDGEVCYFGNTFAIDADTDEQKNQYGAVAYIEANNADAIRVRRGNIRHEAGYYLGLRPMTRVVTSDYTILPNEDCVVIADSTNNPLFVYVPTPSSLLNGAFIEVHNVGNATITLDTEGMGRIHYDGTNSTQRTLEPSKTARLVFSGERNIWYMTIV